MKMHALKALIGVSAYMMSPVAAHGEAFRCEMGSI